MTAAVLLDRPVHSSPVARGRAGHERRVPYPTLRSGTPVVWRQPGVIQVGFDLTLPQAPPAADAALRLLDGTVPLTHVASRTGVDVDWLCRAVDQLTAAGVVSRVTRARVAVAGAGALAEAVAAAVEDTHLVSTWPSAVAPDVVVIAGTTLASRELCDELVAEATTHLVVSPTPGGAAVGPFVCPGSTPCQRCCDLTMAARDPSWPVMVVQAQAQELRCAAAAVAWAAGLAAAQVDAYVRGHDPASIGCTWELSDGDVGVRRWPRHPDCTCATVVAARDGRPWR